MTVEVVRQRTTPVYRQGIGTIQASYTITMRAQIDGRLSTVDFGEGQNLRKGDVLARIDPVVYQARDNQAIAKATFVLSNVEFDLVQGSKDATMVTAGLPPPVLDRRETRGDSDLDVPCLCFREPNSGERRGNRDQQQRRTLDPRSFASVRLLSHKQSFAEAVL